MSDQPCPFCGSHDIRYVPRASKWDYEGIHCDGCGMEMTHYPHVGDVWNTRTDTDDAHCPFCGGDVEYDGVMNHSMFFSDVYCPACKVRFEFQSSRLPSMGGGEPSEERLRKWREKCVTKAMRAFSRRT